jgi:Peptidase family C25/Concanavalin A-like lectin/glucanases superfamily/Domain of unknown function (DUF2341)
LSTTHRAVLETVRETRAPIPIPIPIRSRALVGLALWIVLGTSSLTEAAFTSRRLLTVQAAQVVGGPHANFPVLVRLTDPTLQMAPSGSVQTGQDILFTASDGVTKLDFEIEQYDGTTGTLVAWVRVPSLDTTTQIYLYYGDATVICSQQNRTGVWDSSFREVFHLGETTDYVDSTSSGYTAVTKGSVTQGVTGAAAAAGKAADFVGPAESRLIASDGALPANTSFTLETWVRLRTLQSGLYTGFVVKGRESGFGTGGGDWIGLYKDGASDRFAMAWQCCVANKPGNLVDATTVVNANQWYHIVGVYDGATGFRYLYVNGVLTTSDTTNVALFNNPLPQYLRIGDDSNGHFHDGQIDEVRLSNAVRSAGWIQTTYNTVNPAGTFFTVTNPGAGPATASCPAVVKNPCAGGAGTCNLRSIGTRPDYGTAGPQGTGTQVSTTSGSAIVDGSGATQWVTNNRGRGDRITINGVAYTVAAVESDTRLRLTTPFAAASGTYNYTIARKFKGTVTSPLVDWEDCLDGPGGAGCEGVSSSSLVTDNRSEIGIVYADGSSYTFPASGQPILEIQGSTTDATHTITLTADPANRHLGIQGAGVVFDNGVNTFTALRVKDNFVTLEWIELKGGNGPGVHGVDFVPSAGTNEFVCRDNLIHNISGQAIRVTNLSPFVAVADIANNTIYSSTREGIEINQTLLPGSRVRILNNTLYRNNTSGSAQQIGSVDTTGTNPYVLMRNNIFVANGFTPLTDVPWPNVGSSNNITGDAAPPTAPCDPGPPPTGTCFNSDLGASPRGGGQYSRSQASLAFVTAGTNFHIGSTSVAKDAGADLTNAFFTDIDGATWFSPWDVGSDEFGAVPTIGSGCAVGSVPAGPNYVLHGAFDLGKISTGGGPAGNNFTSSVPYNDWDCPGDTGQTIRTTSGFCGGTNTWLSQFPGDPAAGVAAASNSLYQNGNSTGGPAILWRQTANGLQPNTSYVFFLYASNGNNGPVVQPPILPMLRFCKGVTGTGPYNCATQLNAADFAIANETTATGDFWQRYQVAFTTGPAETSVDLAILDTATNTNGDDVQVTQIGVRACSLTTAVTLTSLEALPSDAAVELTWRTGAELDNLGFHLYRSTSEDSPFERITDRIIPGLGSSPAGASYVYRDTGLANGTTYYYELEDVETTGRTKRHGPVSATPAAGLRLPSESGDEEPEDAADQSADSARITYGDPASSSIRELKRTASRVLLELRTGGFYAIPQPDGSVALEIPGFDVQDDSGAGIPVERHWLDATVGRRVEIRSVATLEEESFASLRPATAEVDELAADRRANVSLRRSRARGAARVGNARLESAARVETVAFQGETKKALRELRPLRWDAARGQLRLAHRVLVEVSFRGREPEEQAEEATAARRGRRVPRYLRRQKPVSARLVTVEPGLYGASFNEVFGRSARVEVSRLRLSRGGEAVAFHVEPATKWFGPGSTIYFTSDGAAANPYGNEAVFELEVGTPGEMMAERLASPSGEATAYYWKRLDEEENHFYQAALLDAPDPWLWDALMAPTRKSYPFEIRSLAGAAEAARLEVQLQGASDLPADPDHHVRVYVNGSLVTEDWWNGKEARLLSAELGPGLLQEGENLLELENVGDTGASDSMVMLDRYAVTYPHSLAAEHGRLEGRWSRTGTAVVQGLGEHGYVLDVTNRAHPEWLRGIDTRREGMGFHADEGRSYLVVASSSVLSPEVRRTSTASWTSTKNRADYLVIGPRALLEAAVPLISNRQKQGLVTAAVPIEDVYAEFGDGESTPQAVKDFIAYAYHFWAKPSPRYVLLVGDATYDFKDYLGTGVQNQVPPLLVKTSYLWTVSDPTLAAVNGDDLLPDLAIGRLPAKNPEELNAMIDKILAYESGDTEGLPTAVLIADNPDPAGDFVANADDLAATVLRGLDVRKIYLPRLGTAATRSSIVEAFDEGASLVSYIGHGGIHLWADEDLFDISQVDSLASQSRQPLLLTMDCLNGYFDFPYFDSLAEALLKAPDKGVIAAFSPSGLSLDAPAQMYQKVFLRELLARPGQRLGDVVVAAQADFLDTGAFPELLTIYQLLGDPALKLPALLPPATP